jgi:cytochrome c5
MKKLTIILFVTVLAACSASKNSSTNKTTNTTSTIVAPVKEVNPELASAQAKVPGITMQELADGKRLFVERCSNCHALKSPSDYTPQQWEPILARMTMRAHIYDDAQKRLIKNYLVANSKG